MRPGRAPPEGVSQPPLWQSRFVVPQAAVALFLDALEGEALSVAAFEEWASDGTDNELWRIELLHRAEPEREALAARLVPLAERAGLKRIDVTVLPVATTDWLARTAESFPAQPIGRFWVHGSHIAEPPPAGTLAIRLDAGLAFGSGEHASTRGCLLALERLARRRRFRRILDLGCGSGILAIASARLWPARVIAADNDPVAVEVTRANADRNGVGHRIRALASEGYRNPLIRAGGPYDLIVANILADPLCELARTTARHLAPGGALVLSGLLDRQALRVIEAHRRYRLALQARIDVTIWTTLVLRRRAGSPRPQGGVRRPKRRPQGATQYLNHAPAGRCSGLKRALRGGSWARRSGCSRRARRSCIGCCEPRRSWSAG
jgi:ribosomal protein L11 methyltransferase